MPKRCRSDLNQAVIVSHLRQIGASVRVVSQHGIGFDLLVAYRRMVYLVEVKRPGKSQDLTDNEAQTMAKFSNYLVIECVDDFLRQTIRRGQDDE